jgi:hypothetical protein
MTRFVALCLLPVLPALGCTGRVSDDPADVPGPPSAPAGRPGGGTAAAPSPTPPAGPATTPTGPSEWTPGLAAGDPSAVAVLPLRLLTRVEYNNTVRDLLGDASEPANGFPVESADETGFAKVQRIDDVNVGAYLDAADAVAGRAVADLPKLLGCAPTGAGEEACVKGFIERFGQRAYRRPLAAAEVGEHLGLYKDKLRGTLKLGTPDAVRALVAAMLQSPYFLYRWENGWRGQREGQAVRLDPYHVASQLSYLLWASMPDADLLAAAGRDELRTPEQLEAQARRLLADPRAERTLAAFHEQWLETTALPGLVRNRAVYPRWSATLAEAMTGELRRFVAEIVLRGDGKLETLLSSTRSFANAPLASVYGLSGVAGMDLQPVELPAGERAGLLTLAGVQAAHADENEPSPILRGKFVRERLLCMHIPPPPDMVPDLPPPEENVPKKDRFAMHAQASCKGCHDLIDPIGFGFEAYDSIGAFRTKDGKFPIDDAGVITGLDGQDRQFANGRDLVKLLAGSQQVRECVVRQWFRYGFSRVEGKADDHTLDRAFAALRDGGDDLRALLVALGRSRAITHRALGPAEEVSK